MEAVKEYGVLVYDIPETEQAFYTALVKKISRMSIPINLSVYLIPFGMKGAVLKMVDEAMVKAKNPAGINVDVLKFDSQDKDEIERIMRRELARILEDLKSRIGKAIVKLREKGEGLTDTKKKYYETRLDNLQSAAFIFGLSEEILDACNAIKHIIHEEN